MDKAFGLLFASKFVAAQKVEFVGGCILSHGKVKVKIGGGFEMALRIFLNIVGIENTALVKIIQIFNDVWEASYAIPLIIHANIAVFSDGGDDFFGVNIGADAERIIGFFAV